MITKYNQYIKESIRDKMKPKSEDEIKKSLKKMNTTDKLKTSIKNDLYWLAEEAIEELDGVIPKDMVKLIVDFIEYNGIDIDIFKLLIHNGLDLKDYPNLLIELIENEFIDIVELLLERKIYDVHHHNDLALLKAITTGNIDMVKLLISYGADAKKVLRIFKLKPEKYHSEYDYDTNENIKKIIKYLESIS